MPAKVVKMQKKPQLAIELGNNQATDAVQSLLKRYTALQEVRQAMVDDIKDLFAEAKAKGFDTKVLRKVFREALRDRTERVEEEATKELYMALLGLTEP